VYVKNRGVDALYLATLLIPWGFNLWSMQEQAFLTGDRNFLGYQRKYNIEFDPVNFATLM